MLKVVHLLSDLWAEFLPPSSGSKGQFNPTHLCHLIFSFLREYSEIFTILLSPIS